jgi:hypothetical protein
MVSLRGFLRCLLGFVSRPSEKALGSLPMSVHGIRADAKILRDFSIRMAFDPMAQDICRSGWKTG